MLVMNLEIQVQLGLELTLHLGFHNEIIHMLSNPELLYYQLSYI
jgi:hypothetical protein